MLIATTLVPAYAVENNDTTGDTDPSGTVALTATQTAGEVKLIWELDGSAPRGFKVVRSTENTAPTYPPQTGDKYFYLANSESDSYTDEAVEPDTTYYYRVCLYTGSSCDIYSNAVSITTDDTTPEPSLVLEGEANSLSIKLEWELDGKKSRGFKVVRSRENTEPTYPPQAGDSFRYLSNPDSRSYLDRDVTPDNTYYYRVCLYDGNDCLLYSNALTLTTRTTTVEDDKEEEDDRGIRDLKPEEIETLEVDEERDCDGFDKNDDNRVDKYERVLCRAKKLREHFKDSNRQSEICEKFDVNADGVVDRADIRACKVRKVHAQKQDSERAKEKKEKREKYFEKALRPIVLEIRWGNLGGDVAKDLAMMDYNGELTIVGGTLKILHPILFEERDSVLTREGTTVSWESAASVHFDGILVKVLPLTPEFDATGELASERSLTLTLGSYTQTWQLGGAGESGFFGRHPLGGAHEVEIRDISKLDEVPEGVSDATSNRLIDNKILVSDKLNNIYKRLRTLEEADTITETTLINFETFQSTVLDYNFFGRSLDKALRKLTKFSKKISEEEGEDINNSKIAKYMRDFNKKFDDYKGASSQSKYTAGLTPFRDVDDDKWYGSFVTYAKDNGIVNGYQGTRAGEYGPADPVTVAEVLKMSLRAADHVESASTDDR